MTESDESTIVARRDAALAKMTPALQAIARNLARRMVRETSEFVAWRYDLGLQVAQILREEARYGGRAVEQLAAFLGMKPSALYDLRNLTQTFSREEVLAAVKPVVPTDGSTRLSHLLAIMRIRDPKHRLELLQGAVLHGWSVRQLAGQIALLSPQAPKPSTAGRKPARPTSPAAAAHILTTQVGALLHRLAALEAPLLDEILEMPPAKADHLLLAKLEAADREFQRLREQIPRFRERLKQNIDRCARLLASKEWAAEKSAEPRTDDDPDDPARAEDAGDYDYASDPADPAGAENPDNYEYSTEAAKPADPDEGDDD